MINSVPPVTNFKELRWKPKNKKEKKVYYYALAQVVSRNYREFQRQKTMGAGKYISLKGTKKNE